MTHKETNAGDSAYGYGYCTADGSCVRDESGLTKREYFAAMALQGILSAGKGVLDDKGDPTNSTNRIAYVSVLFADALIEQLNKSGNP